MNNLLRVNLAVVVEAQDEFGFPYIVDELRREEPHVIWLSLEPDDAGDKVAQGDKLSEATGQAFSAPLFGTGLPFTYGVSVLRRHLDVLAPVTFVLANAEYGVALAHALLAFAVPEARVILQFQRIPVHFELPSKIEKISQVALRLQLTDAMSLARDRLPPEVTELLWRQSQGEYETFMELLNQRLGLPLMARPGPTGSVDTASTPRADLPVLFASLLESQRWIEAFEVAVRKLPEQVPEIIDRAGDEYFTRGMFEPFWNLFKLLPSHLLSHERVAYWRFSAALATNRHRELESEVAEYLRTNEAAELRALVAVSMPQPSMLDEAAAAHSFRENSITARALGFAYAVNGEPGTGAELLLRANRFARQEGNKQLLVATSNELAMAYQIAGRYREAHRWASLALEQFTDFGMQEELRRLFIISEVAYPALLIGRVETVSSLLDSLTMSRELFGIPSLEGLISTLSEYALVRGDNEAALMYAENNLQHLPSTLRGYGVNGMVRALVASGQSSRAEDLAESEHFTSQASSEVERLRLTLALGTALAVERPAQALPYLEDSQDGFQRFFFAPALAQATIVLAGAYLRVEDVEASRRALGVGEVALRELGEVGWRLLGGDHDEIEKAWELWNEDAPPLEIRFLGSRKARLKHKTREFPLRWCEILAVLAYHRAGISGERLALQLYSDGGNMTTIKSNLSRLRKEIPIDSRPYRIDLPFRADFVEMDEALSDGRVREALETYQGPLLPESEAPFVVEMREHLEESLRQAALASGDAEVLLSLARKLKDDLELWEAVSQRLSPNDPQLALARAHVKRIQRSWDG